MGGWGYGGGAFDDLEVVGRRKVSAEEQRERQFKGLRQIPNGDALAAFLKEQRFLCSRAELGPVGRWLEAVNRGEDVRVMTVICPDYATRWNEREQRREYTFDGLGTGIGLVAERALAVHVALSRFLGNLGKSAQFVLAMADQEAIEANCARVGVNREEFLARLRQSQQALAAAAPEGMTLETPFLTEMNPTLWQSSLDRGRQVTERIRAGEHAVAVRRAVQMRARFYSFWAGRQLSGPELNEMLFGHVHEYIALGTYVTEGAVPTFVIGADSPDMGPFVRILPRRELALLYLERPSY